MLEAAVQVARESHTSLLDLLDYENGVTVDQLQEYYAAVTKNAAQQKKMEVAVLQTAIAGLFDHKIVSKFNDTLQTIVQSIERSLPQKSTASREEEMRQSMVELRKLTTALTAR